MAWTDNSFKFPFQKEQEKRNDPKYKNVPLIVAPGKEDAYLEEKAKHDAAKVAEAERIIQEKKEAEAQQTETDEQQQAQSEEELQDQPPDFVTFSRHVCKCLIISGCFYCLGGRAKRRVK